MRTNEKSPMVRNLNLSISQLLEGVYTYMELYRKQLKQEKEQYEREGVGEGREK
jgi:hypothetical protein